MFSCRDTLGQRPILTLAEVAARLGSTEFLPPCDVARRILNLVAVQGRILFPRKALPPHLQAIHLQTTLDVARLKRTKSDLPLEQIWRRFSPAQSGAPIAAADLISQAPLDPYSTL
jgi:hypothetical protein